jgi:endonuclease YncB( thermonuclease family)
MNPPAPVVVMLVLLFGGRVLIAAPLPDVEGRAVVVHDGDTITVLTPAKMQVKVRLEGIDAPESKQPFGAKAKEQLSALVFGKIVAVQWNAKDRYGRVLGRVFCDGMDVNELMVGRGFAWRYVQQFKDPKLIEAERYARQHRRGLWADAEPVPPWEWRRR